MVNEETPLLAKFTNFLTKKGQKAKAGRIMKKVCKVLQNLQPLVKNHPLMVIQKLCIMLNLLLNLEKLV